MIFLGLLSCSGQEIHWQELLLVSCVLASVFFLVLLSCLKTVFCFLAELSCLQMSVSYFPTSKNIEGDIVSVLSVCLSLFLSSLLAVSKTVVTISVHCMCIVRPSGFDRTITSTFMHEFQKYVAYV